MGHGERPLAVVILAAGQGTRMNSSRAKVLHELGGRPLLGWPVAAAEALEPEHLVVVVGRDAEQVKAQFAGRARFVVQADQNGTGHAVQQAEPALRGFSGDVLVLYGDVPLLREETLRALARHKAETGADLAMLTSPAPLPGLVVRGPDGRVRRIVEQTDATEEELRIQEGNTGVYLLDAELLWKTLGQLDDRNEQGELYLTDVVERAVSEGRRVEALRLADATECLGVNDRRELAEAEAVLRSRTLERLMADGVTFVDAASAWVDADVTIGRDTVIEPGVRITGPTTIGAGCHVKPHCVIESSRIGDGCEIGPSAHLRPGCVLHDDVRIGNFVEVKNSELGRRREGRPSELHRRRRRRRRRGLRRGLHHGQLRLGEEAPHQGGRGRPDRVQREPGRADRDRAGGVRRCRHHRHEARSDRGDRGLDRPSAEPRGVVGAS